MDYNDAGLSGISVDGKEAEVEGENIYEMQIPSGSSEVKVQPSANSIFVKRLWWEVRMPQRSGICAGTRGW